MTLTERIQAARARQLAASKRHDLAGVAAAKAVIADLQTKISARRA